MNFIVINDFILLPVYLLIIYVIAGSIRNSKYGPRHPLRKYYLPALTVKIVGALGIGLVYQYYYGIRGDTANYFLNGNIVSEIFDRSPSDFFELVFLPISASMDVRAGVDWINPDFGYNESNFFPVRILALVGLLTFNTYLPGAVIVAFISFLGIWKLFSTFVHIQPALSREFAIAFLFMPSVFFWGSGILKDTIVITALCWLFYSSYLLFILRIKFIRAGFILFFAALTMMVVKPYVALAFFPSLIFWIFFQYRNQIRSYSLRVFSLPFILGIIFICSFYVLEEIGRQNKKYATDNLIEQAITFNVNNRAAGSSIDLGISGDAGTFELLTLAPLAIITTLFRPFFFEVSNPLMALSALEGSFLLFLFLFILFKVGLIRSFKVISQDPLLAFCLIFSLIFAVGIGISTSNFGTIVRYKIPCIPFFMAALFILRAQSQKKQVQLA